VAKNAVPSSSGGGKAKAFNGTKTPPSGPALRPIPVYPDTTGDREARVTLRRDTATNRVAPSKTVNSPSSSNATSRQVAGTKTSGGARITGGNP
jgi:hypothetical protein